MARVSIQELPSDEELLQSSELMRVSGEVDIGLLRTSILFSKLVAEFESQAERFFSSYQLTKGRLLILILLVQESAGLKPTDISEKIGVTASTVSGFIKHMLEAGLIERVRSDLDSRSFVIKISEKGEFLVREILPQWHEKEARLWSQFTGKEMSELQVTFGRMIDSIKLLKS